MVPATAQFIYQAHDLDKPEMIGRLLQAEGADLMIVFTRTKRQAQRIADDLEERGFNSAPLHGDMAQAAREKALTRFREGKLQVLVATDVAARGIDVTGVTHVVNYSCPEDEKTYVHRIGRTGRAGATGIAITFVDWSDLHRWKMINKALDLPFDDPQETYSSSENFLHDQGIAPGTKGRLIPEGQASSSASPIRSGRDRGGQRRWRPWSATATAVAQRRRPAARAAARTAARAGEAEALPTRVRRPSRRASATAAGDAPAAASPAGCRRAADADRSGGDDDLRADRREVPQRLMASGSACRMQPCDCGRAELRAGLQQLAVLGRDAVEPDRGVVAAREAHEVLHHAGVVDADGPARASSRRRRCPA